MTVEAKIIADSISPDGVRITTFQLRYPRFIHAEELTHRILETTPEVVIYEAIPDGLMYDPNLSRNASSSRAIPVNRMIADLLRDPAMPIYWGSNKPGMQAGEELSAEDIAAAKQEWMSLMITAIDHVERLVELGLHKQIANRLLEPWAHINVVVTATQWQNFFGLRSHKDAQPEIKLLSDLMQDEMALTIPHKIQLGEWHLPFITADDYFESQKTTTNGTINYDLLKKVSVARCARVSYLTFEGKQTTVEEDLTLYDRLLGSQPLHASPAEHQATPDRFLSAEWQGDKYWDQPELHGNLKGWIQYRKTLPGEFIAG